MARIKVYKYAELQCRLAFFQFHSPIGLEFFGIICMMLHLDFTVPSGSIKIFFSFSHYQAQHIEHIRDIMTMWYINVCDVHMELQNFAY